MIRNVISVVLLAAVGLAIWRIWGAGGDIAEFFNAIWGIFYAVVDAVSVALVTAYNTVFGITS